ncbi:MAG: tetratricopeptide repeat protein [Planctomycetia bacterium]|nr:tetratricopeptide repeat protein [Planctomycetia bacterium]
MMATPEQITSKSTTRFRPCDGVRTPASLSHWNRASALRTWLLKVYRGVVQKPGNHRGKLGGIVCLGKRSWLVVIALAGWSVVMPSDLFQGSTLVGLRNLFSHSVARADQASDDYAVAVGFYKQSRWSLAAEAFKKFLTQNPKHERVPFARLYLGLSLTNLEKYDGARTILRAFVKDFPNNQQVAQAMYRVAEASYFLDDLKAAEAEFIAFLMKSPEDALREYALPYLGDTQLRLGNAEQASQSFQQSIKLYPQSKMFDDSRYGLAKTLEAQQKFAEALDLYRQMAANRTGSRAALSQLQIGVRLFEMKDYVEAAKAYVDLEKNFPDSKYISTSRLNAGYAFYELKDFKAAATQFELASKDPEQAPTASYWRGMSQKQLGDFAGSALTLKAAFVAHEENPIAEQILFQWADCELRQAQFEAAELHFVDVAKRWPQGQWADDALYFAGEAALQRANRAATPEARTAALQSAETISQQFLASYGSSGLKLYIDLLRGRVLLVRGSDAEVASAAEIFKVVLATAQRPQTQAQARFHLARAQQRLKQHAAVLETLVPIVEQARKEGAASEFIDSLVLQASSLLSEKKYAESVDAAASYLKLTPTGEQVAQAHSTKALAEANLGQFDIAKQTLAQLQRSVPGNPLVLVTTQQVAEAAYAAKQFEVSLELFGAVVSVGPSQQFVAALSGQAWSQFDRKQFKLAAVGFARLLKDHPQHELAPEAAFMLGDSLQAVGQLVEAAKAFGDAFDKYTPNRFAYLSGLQSARVLGRLKQVPEADAAYAKLLEKFPKPERLDRLFDEWAMLNYEAERYTRADEIFKRLIAEAPGSDLVDNARFSLVESQMSAIDPKEDVSVKNKKLEEVKAAFRQLEQDPKSDSDVQQDSLLRLLGVAEEQQQWDELAKTADSLQTRFPEGRYKTDAAFYLAVSLLQRKQLAPAFELLKPLTSAKADPDVAAKLWFPRVFVLLAEINYQQKKYLDAVATIAEFRAWDGKNRLLYQGDEVLGRALKQQTKFDEARVVFQQVIDDPNGTRTETAAKAQLMIAETYFIQKDFKAALENYLKVYILYKFPDWQAAALFQVGLCDEQLGEWGKAVTDYESLLNEFPKSEFVDKAKPRLDVARQNAKK